MERENTLTLKRVKDPPPSKTDPNLQLGGPQSGFPPPFIIGQELAPYLIVGIDFGSNFCRVCTFSNGAPYAVQPSSFSSLVEDVLLAPRETSQFVHSAKMCLAFDYLVKHGGATYTASEVISKMLKKLKEGVERSTERLLAKAVISVPAGFNHAQREALRQAAEGAGVAVLGLINEPTAAALHACFMQNLRNGRYLVISSGTYSFEVSVVHVQNRLIETKALRGVQSLSGQAVNVDLAEGIQRGFDLPDINELVLQVDQAKKELDSKGAAVIQAGGKSIAIDRTTAAKHLERIMNGVHGTIDTVLKDAGIEPMDITGTILSGNSTNSWLLREELQHLFPQAAMYTGNVSAGCAVYAALLVRQAKDWVVWDALADPVFVIQGNQIKEVVGKNSPLPINGHAAISPGEDGTAFATIMQRSPDASEDLIPVASVRIVEELQQTEEGAVVDLSVSATADGILSIGARHKLLDVNLTVETSAPFREERTIVDLDGRSSATAAAEPPIEVVEWFGGGLTVKEYGDYWLVDSVLDESPAEMAGIQEFDEIMAVNTAQVEELGRDVPESLKASQGEVKHLWIRRGGMAIQTDFTCTLPRNQMKDVDFNRWIADATLSGDQARLVRGLLNLARQEMVIHQPAVTERVDKAVTRANEIAWKELPDDQALCLEAASMSLKTLLPRAIHVRSVQDEIIGQINLLFANITVYLSAHMSWQPRVMRVLVELINDMRVAFGPLGSAENTEELITTVRAIGAECGMPDALINCILSPDEPAKPPKSELPISWTRIRPSSEHTRKLYIHRLKLSLSPEITDFVGLVRGFGDLVQSIEKAGLISPEVIAQNPLHAAQCFMAHGLWWLQREVAGTQSEPTLVELDEQVRQNPRVIPCFNSKEAYEIARLIMHMLDKQMEGPLGLSRQAFVQSKLAVCSAAVDDYQAASDCTDGARRLNLKFQNETGEQLKGGSYTVSYAYGLISDIVLTINYVCGIYLLKKRYHSIHNYCIAQLRKIDSSNAHGRKEMSYALLNLARVYAITAEFELAKDAYERLIPIAEDDEQTMFTALESYTEFLVRMDDTAASKIVERTEALGRRLGVINDQSAPAWLEQWTQKRGKKEFA